MMRINPGHVNDRHMCIGDGEHFDPDRDPRHECGLEPISDKEEVQDEKQDGLGV